MLRLEVIYGKDAGKCMQFQQSVVHIGSEIGNDFQLTDPDISGFHGRFTCSDPSHYAYCDLQSAQGSRIQAASIDIFLYNHQLPQVVSLAGKVVLSIGQSKIRCDLLQDAKGENCPILKLASRSLSDPLPPPNISLSKFLFQLSLGLMKKVTHQAVMSYLSQAIFNYMPHVTHMAIWRLDEMNDELSCAYERSREGVITSSMREDLLRAAITEKNAVLYEIEDNGNTDAIVSPLFSDKRNLGILMVNARGRNALGESELNAVSMLSKIVSCAVDRTFFNADMSALFDGFVRAIIAVMDARDPASAGHSRRVSKYALITAQAIHASHAPAFKDVQFTGDHLDELRFAALLHDIGKVALRREILLKSSKLSHNDLQNLLDRISLFWAWFSTQSPETLGKRYRSRQTFEMYHEVVTRLQQVNAVASERDRALIDEMAQTYVDPCPNIMLLSPSERESLLIEHGTLTPAERHEIERHALISYQYLSQISWPLRWANVPIFVLQHHEKLNGKGYPHGISGSQIRLQSRILSVCDIFDALTGGDRPYKLRHSFADAANVLHKEVDAGALDGNIVEIFIEQVIPQLSNPDDISSGNAPIIGS